MSMQVGIISVNVGAVSNETLPIFRAPTDGQGGGITILAAEVVQGGSTDSSVRLVTLDSTGTVVNGTVNTTAAGGTATPFAANVPKALTIADGFVDGGEYIGVKEGNVAAMNAQALVSIKYVMGKAG